MYFLLCRAYRDRKSESSSGSKDEEEGVQSTPDQIDLAIWVCNNEFTCNTLVLYVYLLD